MPTPVQLARMQLREAARNLVRASDALKESPNAGDALASILCENLSTIVSNIETRVGRPDDPPTMRAARRCPCGEMTINDCAGECGRMERRATR